MADFPPPIPAGNQPGTTTMVPVLVQQPRSWFRTLLFWGMGLALFFSVLLNLGLMGMVATYFGGVEGPEEKFSRGSTTSVDKIAILKATGTIMPPFSGRLIKAIQKATTDDAVKAVLLRIESPGGLVADSHQIYHKLKQLSAKKPVVVSFGSLAASGGYYIAMGGGPKAKIFAEPITWTGSIGVIIPHFEASELASKVGVKSEPLKTGEFKDTLSPFKPLSDNERKLWGEIIGQSFDRFVNIIDENRDTLNREQILTLATGQIFTADDAVKNGLVDAIGFEDEAFAEALKLAGLKEARGVEYSHPTTFIDILTASMRAQSPESRLAAWLEAGVPREMYYFSRLPVLPIELGR
jgi:protease IV